MSMPSEEMQRVRQIIQTQAEAREQYLQQKTYIHQQIENEEQLYQPLNQKALTRKKLGKVRDIVARNMPEAYVEIDRIRMAPTIAERTAELHHSRGKHFATNGAKVLEFDIAGSGFHQFRSEHKGFHGQHLVDAQGNKEEKEFLKEKKVRWYHKYLSWIPGISSREQVEAENERVRTVNQALKEKYHLDAEDNDVLKQARKRRMEEQFGTSQKIGGKVMEDIRRKDSMDGKKTRISMAGPINIGGLLNAGEYSIENLRNYMLTMGSDYLEKIFFDWMENPLMQKHEIRLLIRGHSRGGVAAGEGAMMIKKWVHDNYPDYERYVKFDLIQYDPVPGEGSTWQHRQIDHTGDGTISNGKGNMMSLGDSAETTVVYSMHTEHSSFFDPQAIKGAKRILLTPFRHGVDLGGIDATQAARHREGYTDAQSGEVYRSSGLNDLAAGVYIVDERNTLIRMDNYARAEIILKEFVKDTDNQDARHQILLDCVKAWFDAHSINPSVGTAE